MFVSNHSPLPHASAPQPFSSSGFIPSPVHHSIRCNDFFLSFPHPALLFLGAVSCSLNLSLLFSFALPAPVSHTPRIHSSAIFAPTLSSLHPKMTHLWISIKCVPATLKKKKIKFLVMHRNCLLQPLCPSAESPADAYFCISYLSEQWLWGFCALDSAVKCKGTIIKNTFFLLLVIYCFLLAASLFLEHHHFA